MRILYVTRYRICLYICKGFFPGCLSCFFKYVIFFCFANKTFFRNVIDTQLLVWCVRVWKMFFPSVHSIFKMYKKSNFHSRLIVLFFFFYKKTLNFFSVKLICEKFSRARSGARSWGKLSRDRRVPHSFANLLYCGISIGDLKNRSRPRRNVCLRDDHWPTKASVQPSAMPSDANANLISFPPSGSRPTPDVERRWSPLRDVGVTTPLVREVI